VRPHRPPDRYFEEIGLEDTRENYQNCLFGVSCTTVEHIGTNTHEQFLMISVGFGLGLVYVHLLCRPM